MNRGNFDREIETVKNQMEILKLKSTRTENVDFDLNLWEQEKGSMNLKTDFPKNRVAIEVTGTWEAILEPNTAIPQKEKKGNEAGKKYLKKSWPNISWILDRFTDSRTSASLKYKHEENTVRHITVKLLKTKDKEKVLEAARELRTCHTCLTA